MDVNLVVAIVGAVASIAAAVIANRFTSRSARSAQQQSARMEQTKVDADAYQRARENYDAALATQEKRIAQLTAEAEEDRKEYREEIAGMKMRIRELEEARREDQRRIREFVVWARQVISLMRAHGIEYPLPPQGLDDI